MENMKNNGFKIYLKKDFDKDLKVRIKDSCFLEEVANKRIKTIFIQKVCDHLYSHAVLFGSVILPDFNKFKSYEDAMKKVIELLSLEFLTKTK